MRTATVAFIAAICCSSAALAQNQQAGNEASTNADETFKKLIEQCNDTDTLVLRARVRLAMGRLEDQAAIKTLNGEVNKGLSLCGEGKLDDAKAALKKTLTNAEAKVTEKFGQDETPTVKAQADDTKEKPKGSGDGKSDDKVAKGDESKPWWKFW